MRWRISAAAALIAAVMLCACAGPGASGAGAAAAPVVTGDTAATVMRAATVPAPTPQQTPPEASDPHLICAIGDSITSGIGNGEPWPTTLQRLAGPGVTVRNLGVAGWTSAGIAVHLGAVRVTAARSTWLPAIGAATVPLSFTPMIGLQRAGYETEHGRFGDIPGTLDLATGVFAPDGGPRLHGSLARGAAFIPDSAARCRTATLVIWVGQNDLLWGGAYADTAPADTVQAIIGTLAVTHPHVLVIGVTAGDAQRAALARPLNALIRSRFAADYISVQSRFTDPAVLTAAGFTLSASDRASMSAGIAPATVYTAADRVHPNALANRAVIAPFVLEQLARRGWLPRP